MKKTLMIIGLVAILLLAMGGIAWASHAISSWSPTTGPITTKVTINGSGFGSDQGTSSVLFGGIAATNIYSWSSAKIEAHVPTGLVVGQAYSVQVVVGDTVTAAGTFTVQGLPWTDDQLIATTRGEHYKYLTGADGGCAKCHMYAAGYDPTATGESAVAAKARAVMTGPSMGSIPQPGGPDPYTGSKGSFRGLRAINAVDMCDYCHVSALPYSAHQYEFMNPAIASIPVASQGLQKNPKSGHRVGGSVSGVGWSNVGNRATPMSSKTLSTRQMSYLGAGGRPQGPPVALNLTCTSCHSVHQNAVQDDQMGGFEIITRFSDAKMQLLRKNPAHDDTDLATFVWDDPGSITVPGIGTINEPADGSSQWYAYFCADCHNAAHVAAGRVNIGGDTTTLGHRWTTRPYVYSDVSLPVSIQKATAVGAGDYVGIPRGSYTGTRADGYIEDFDTWNTTDEAPTCRQCHSVRARRPSASAQGNDPRRPRFPHLGVTSDQLLRDNTNAELGGLSLGVARIAGINALTAMTSAPWPPRFYDAGSGEEMIIDANAVCVSCHSTATLP